MKAAVIGSRNIIINNLQEYVPPGVTEIVSGGAKGVDSCARTYAAEHNKKLTEFLPDYARYGKAAPLKRNIEIINYADVVIAFWDGHSRGTKYVIDHCKAMDKKIFIYYKK